MKFVQFQFNNFFDYSIIAKQLKSKKWKLHPNNLTAIFNYEYTSAPAIKYMEQLCKPLNIQFLTTDEISKDPE